ncbi:MAG: hypothetical protein H6678_06320 [Candidatus Delongbacteria bacterium]|nr:hypothetical protein [Candidatus Delongbacteria bacterium]
MDTRLIARNALLGLLLLSLVAFGWKSLSSVQDTKDPLAGLEDADRSAAVQAVYYHGNFRCETCNSIEAQAGQTFEDVFAGELASGRLAWSSCNIDKAGNEHFEEDFQLTSASLVLSDGKGAPCHWKVLEKTWELVGDSLAFREYVVAETRAFLKDTP